MDYPPGQKINCRSGEVAAIKNTGSNFSTSARKRSFEVVLTEPKRT